MTDEQKPAPAPECACRKALHLLVSRLDAVHQDERYKAVWISYMIHGGNYTDPKYDKELDVAREFLASPCPCDSLRDENTKLRAAAAQFRSEALAWKVAAQTHEQEVQRLKAELATVHDKLNSWSRQCESLSETVREWQNEAMKESR